MHFARSATGLHRDAARRCIGGAVGLLGAIVLAAAPAQADPDPSVRAGIWTLSVGVNKHECRMVLHAETTAHGLGLAMPPGCRKALPDLMPVQAWSMPDDSSVSLDDASGQPILIFASPEGGVFHASDSQGNPLTLAKLDQTRRTGDEGSIVSLNPVAAGYAKAKAEAKAAVPDAQGAARPQPVTTTETLGNYAVLRGDRDTGCMVTLDSVARGPKGTLKARLAPACRDQGIVVFDPLGWQLQANALVLTARKGHTVRLERDAAGLWVKQPEDIKGLTLKRL